MLGYKVDCEKAGMHENREVCVLRKTICNYIRMLAPLYDLKTALKSVLQNVFQTAAAA